MASAKVRAQHDITDAQEAASIGARVDPKSGKWFDLKDGHYIAPAEADQRLGRTTAQGNADRAQGNGGGWLDQLVERNQGAYGNLLKNVAPLASLLPGVGPLVSAGIAGLGQSIIPGANLGDAVKQGAVGGLEGAGVGALGSATGLSSAIAGAPNAATMSPGALASAANASAPSGGLGGLTSIGQNLLPKVAALAGGGGGTQNGGGISGLLSGLGTTIPAGLEAANAAALQGQSTQYAKDALNTVKGQWDTQAPLRTAGMAGLLNPSTPAPGLPEIQALRGIASTGNPFAQRPNAPPALGLPQPTPLAPTPVQAGKPIPPTGSLPSGLPTPQPVGGPGGAGNTQLVY